ncbi:SWIM-type domain-containing protein [Mycena venus]|uniref:SWIM-type domain-containing protein n=1 Tax=Mycena venus TaxID=2733690 RepID=A0A8H6X2Z7_9AGAR|nr:SWIM-type domain-containing protein [Mycena venus]
MSEILWKRDKAQLPSAEILLKEFGDEVDGLDPLKGKIVEIAADAAYGTNSKHLELYAVMAEHDNAGFPAVRKCALEAWAQELGDKYGLIPVFIHTDKDITEIGMARNRAKAEFGFIDLAFRPYGRADPTEHEGGFLASTQVVAASAPGPHPNSVGTIKIPVTQPRSTAPTDVTNTQKPTRRNPVAMEIDDSDDTPGQHTFCPVEFHQPIVDFMEVHLCAHPLIPGYSHPSLEGIRSWAVRQAYTFCFEHNLREV